MARSWYILHTYTGYEQKINRTLNTLLAENKLDPAVVLQIKVPTEEVVDVRKYPKAQFQSPPRRPGQNSR